MDGMERKHGPNRRHGFTLAEVLLASTILAFVVSAVTQAIVAGQQQTYAALHEQRAVALVEAMVEEVLSKPYADPQASPDAGPDAGETLRSLFDNADDYHNFSQAAGAVTDAADAAYPVEFNAFARSVTCVYGSQNVAALGGTINGLIITVTVTDPTERSWTLTRFVPEPAP